MKTVKTFGFYFIGLDNSLRRSIINKFSTNMQIKSLTLDNRKITKLEDARWSKDEPNKLLLKLELELKDGSQSELDALRGSIKGGLARHVKGNNVEIFLNKPMNRV